MEYIDYIETTGVIMLLHSVMLKRIGVLAAAVGFALIVVMAAAFFALQQYAIVWGYFTTAGVYFVVFGVIFWIIGAAKEPKEQEEIPYEAPSPHLGEKQ
jgi:hypothetical protein